MTGQPLPHGRGSVPAFPNRDREGVGAFSGQEEVHS
jgi:hypothetical protein